MAFLWAAGLLVVVTAAGGCVPAGRGEPPGSLVFDEHGLDSLSIGVDLPGRTRTEGGLMSIRVYHGELALEPEGLWSDGSPASAALRLSEQDLVAWARRIDSLGLPGEHALTFSIHTPESHGPIPRGTPTVRYLKSRATSRGLGLCSTVTHDGWHRSRWLRVPSDKCSPAVFSRLERSCEIDRLGKLIRELRRHYELNVVDQPTQPSGHGSRPRATVRERRSMSRLIAEDIAPRVAASWELSRKEVSATKLLSDCEFRRVDLNGDGLDEVIVKVNLCLEDAGGARYSAVRSAHDCGSFHIYQVAGKRPRHTGEIKGGGWSLLESRSHGYADLRTYSHWSATEGSVGIYSYRDGEYRLRSEGLYDFSGPKPRLVEWFREPAGEDVR